LRKSSPSCLPTLEALDNLWRRGANPPSTD
jgi:hypothetical protein